MLECTMPMPERTVGKCGSEVMLVRNFDKELETSRDGFFFAQETSAPPKSCTIARCRRRARAIRLARENLLPIPIRVEEESAEPRMS